MLLHLTTITIFFFVYSSYNEKQKFTILNKTVSDSIFFLKATEKFKKIILFYINTDFRLNKFDLNISHYSVVKKAVNFTALGP